jgi:hypothetical protein
LAAFWGVYLVKEHLADAGFADTWPPVQFAVIMFLVGLPLGVASMSGMAWLASRMNQLVDGLGSFRSNLTGFAHAAIPMLWLGVVEGGLYLALGQRVNQKINLAEGVQGFENMPLDVPNAILLGLAIGLVPLFIIYVPWSIIVTAKCVGEANKVSASRGLLLAAVVMGVLIIAGILLAGLLALFGLSVQILRIPW